MSNTAQSPRQEVARIGVVLGDFEKLNMPALQFLVLHMNTLQHWFEYEFLPGSEIFQGELLSPDTLKEMEWGDADRAKELPEEHPFMRDFFHTLSGRVRNPWLLDDSKFVSLYYEHVLYLNQEFGLAEPPPDRLILVTEAKFPDKYYRIPYRDEMSILALGNWERTMAPPSILEFILTLLVRESVAVLCPPLYDEVHYGTKGCLFDFTRDLREARQKVLNGFICSYCQTILQEHNLKDLADDTIRLLDKKWFGRSDDPASSAGIARNLGYDLFSTKGFEATSWEKFLATISQEGMKLPVVVFGAVLGTVLAAVFLLLLGLPQ